MDKKMSPKPIDADILQCKADVLRARNAAIASQQGKPKETMRPEHDAGSQVPFMTEPDQGVHALLEMVSNGNSTKPKQARSSEDPIALIAQAMNQATQTHSAVPAALRPLHQVQVGLAIAVPKGKSPTALRPVGQAPNQAAVTSRDKNHPWISEGQPVPVSPHPSSPEAGPNQTPPRNGMASERSGTVSDSIGKDNLIEKTLQTSQENPSLSPPSGPASRKFRIPRLDEILSWGKRILDDRSPTEAAVTASADSSEMEILRRQRDEALRIRSELDNERTQMISRLDFLTQSLADSEANVRQNADTNRRIQEQITDFQQRIEQLTEQINDARQRLAGREKEFIELQDLLKDEQQLQEQSQQEIKRLQEKIAWSEKERSLFQEQKESAESVLKSMEENFRAASSAKDDLQAQVNRLKELEIQLQQSRRDHRLAQEQATASEKEVAEIRLQLEARQKELSWFRDELHSTQQQTAQQKKQLDESAVFQEQCITLQNEVLERQGEIEKSQAQTAQYREQLARLQEQILQGESERAILNNRLNDTLRHLEESHQETARLKEQVQAQLQTQSALETELAKIRDQRIRLEEMCRERQEHIQRSADELTSTRMELDAVRQQLDQFRQQDPGRLALEEQLHQSETDDVESEMTEITELDGHVEERDVPETLPSEPSDRSPDSDILDQGSPIPEFNLAEQILAEQRKISSSRRQGPPEMFRSPDRSSIVRGIDHVIQSISPAPSRSEPGLRKEIESGGPVPSRTMENLSPIQQEILSEIVAAQISFFCGH